MLPCFGLSEIERGVAEVIISEPDKGPAIVAGTNENNSPAIGRDVGTKGVPKPKNSRLELGAIDNSAFLHVFIGRHSGYPHQLKNRSAKAGHGESDIPR